MQYRPLAQFQVSEVGLGCASYWGKKHFSEQQASHVVQTALEQGINYMDTGASYSGGYAEQRLGRILRHVADKDTLVVSSKVGTEVGRFGRLYKDFSPQNIRHSCERSLTRLGIEQLSVCFLHGPNVEDFNDKTYQTLAELKQAGKVALWGVNTFNPHIIQLTQESHQFDVLMTDFNIFKPHQLNTLKSARQQGLEVIIAGALGSALYSREWQRAYRLKNLWYKLRAFKNNRAQLKAAKYFDFLNTHPDLTATQLALAYVLQFNCFSSALIGSTSAGHIRDLTAVSGQSIPSEYFQQISQAQKHCGFV